MEQHDRMQTTETFDRLAPAIVARGATPGTTHRPDLVVTPRLAALRRAGTHHVYGDSADVRELHDLLTTSEGVIHAEIDGNTANQPLIRKVVARYLDADGPRAWAGALLERCPGLSHSDLVTLLYTIVCARIGNDVTRSFASGRAWEVSLQLHMDLSTNAAAARWVGRLLRRMVPSAFVKVPFSPDAPQCLLVARDLEKSGVPVNLTSTFSARQVVTGALLSDATRTNVFMGRLNQGLQADLLGEHVDLEAQRALRSLRERHGVTSELIVASVHHWQTFVRVAGCDVFTAPCSVIRDFLEQDQVAPAAIESRLDASYEAELGVSAAVLAKLDADRIARLYRIEPELVEFLVEYRKTREYERVRDGEKLYKRFDRAGFGDLFHHPTPAEQEEMARGKLPQLDGTLIQRVPLDTHFTLLANADFRRSQSEIDAEIEKRLEGAPQ